MKQERNELVINLNIKYIPRFPFLYNSTSKVEANKAWFQGVLLGAIDANLIATINNT